MILTTKFPTNLQYVIYRIANSTDLSFIEDVLHSLTIKCLQHILVTLIVRFNESYTYNKQWNVSSNKKSAQGVLTYAMDAEIFRNGNNRELE